MCIALRILYVTFHTKNKLNLVILSMEVTLDLGHLDSDGGRIAYIQADYVLRSLPTIAKNFIGSNHTMGF